MAIELTGMPLGEVVNQQRLDKRVKGELLTLERKDLKLASGLGNPLESSILPEYRKICNYALLSMLLLHM